LINISKSMMVVDDDTSASFLEHAAAVGLKVKDFMTRRLFTTRHDAQLVDAARLMTKHGISGLPVTDEETNLVGVVSKTDVTRAVANEIEPRPRSMAAHPYSRMQSIFSRPR
jgi:CBS domain-containing protein